MSEASLRDAAYRALRGALFALEPERAALTALRALDVARASGLSRWLAPAPRSRPIECMGLSFPNPIGLAAGLDKDGEHIEALAALGFGFLEIGTVTPRPQPGNPPPRVFRLPGQTALINNLGFNSKGLDYVAKRVERGGYRGVLGINIGKNLDTPIERAVEDYLAGLRRMYPLASYLVVNISSPNTPALRELQDAAHLDGLLSALAKERERLRERHRREVPLLVKIDPDRDAASYAELAEAFARHRIDGVVATNTTLSRDGLDPRSARWPGGLSGAPLAARATEAVERMAVGLKGRVPIIGCGGVVDAASAQAKIAAGASLLQCYTGLLYRGPGLLGEVAEAVYRTWDERRAGAPAPA